MSTSSSARDGIGLVQDRKGKRPLSGRPEEVPIGLVPDRKGKRPLSGRPEEVPLAHPASLKDGTTSQRAYTAIKTLCGMGFERREVKLVLKGLLKKTECNWEYIEENSYSALVNAVLLGQTSHALETTNKRIVAESSVSIPHTTQSICTGETVVLDLSDRKGKHPLNERADNLTALKRPKIEVPLMHPPPPENDIDRETAAIKEMKNMGFEEKDIAPVLDRLLKESHNNWRYIELDNYSALVDGILIPEAASMEQHGFMKSQNLDSGVKSYEEERNSWIKPLVPILKNSGFDISGCGEILQKTPGHFKEMWEPKERPKYCGLGYNSNTRYMMEKRPKSGIYGAFVPRQLDVPLAHKKMEENSSNEMEENSSNENASQTLSASAQESLHKF